MKHIRLIIIATSPKEVSDAIQSLREPVCRRHGATWALRYPPHVTLRTGLIAPEGRLPEIFSAFETLLADVHPFPVRSLPAEHSRMAYGGEEHFFVYLPVVKDGLLSDLNSQLLNFQDFRKSSKTAFDPHITLLWGDVPKDAEDSIKGAIDRGEPEWGQCFSWNCDAVRFYIQDASKEWRHFHSIPLPQA